MSSDVLMVVSQVVLGACPNPFSAIPIVRPTFTDDPVVVIR